MFDVVTMGSATKDIFLFAKSSALRARKDSHFLEIPMDRKIEITNELEFTGGGATNAAATFSNFNKRTAIIAKIGNDYNGDFILKELRRMAVSTKYIIRAQGETPFSEILVSSNGHMIILSLRGMANTIHGRELKLDFKSKWMYISPLSGSSYSMLPRVMRHCDAMKIKVALLLGYTELNVGLKGMRDVLKQVDLIIMNNYEAERFIGMANQRKNVIALAKATRGTAIITMGVNGSLVANKGRIYRVGTFHSKAINTVGTGDAYASGFVTGLMEGAAIEDCINLACYNSSGVVGAYGAKTGLVHSYPTKSVDMRVVGDYKT